MLDDIFANMYYDAIYRKLSNGIQAIVTYSSALTADALFYINN